MFEAHLESYIPPNQSPNSHFDEQVIESVIQNQKHSASTWVWSASGKRKNTSGEAIPTLFLYIEYKDSSNASTYICKEIEKNTSVDHQYLQLLVSSLELPDVSVEKTRYWIENELSV